MKRSDFTSVAGRTTLHLGATVCVSITLVVLLASLLLADEVPAPDTPQEPPDPDCGEFADKCDARWDHPCGPCTEQAPSFDCFEPVDPEDPEDPAVQLLKLLRPDECASSKWLWLSAPDLLEPLPPPTVFTSAPVCLPEDWCDLMDALDQLENPCNEECWWPCFLKDLEEAWEDINKKDGRL